MGIGSFFKGIGMIQVPFYGTFLERPLFHASPKALETGDIVNYRDFGYNPFQIFDYSHEKNGRIYYELESRQLA